MTQGNKQQVAGLHNFRWAGTPRGGWRIHTFLFTANQTKMNLSEQPSASFPAETLYHVRTGHSCPCLTSRPVHASPYGFSPRYAPDPWRGSHAAVKCRHLRRSPSLARSLATHALLSCSPLMLAASTATRKSCDHHSHAQSSRCHSSIDATPHLTPLLTCRT